MPKFSTVSLSTAKGFRFSRQSTPCNTARMEKALKTLGVPMKRYLEWTGGQGLREFTQMNPLWTQRQWEEVMLENLDRLV